MTDEEGRIPFDDHNKWADYHRYHTGVNLIPADTKNKKPIVEWAQYQDNPIPEWQHDKWKSDNAFSSGMAVIPGKVWHRQDKKDYYLIALDADKKEAITEICTRNGKTTSLQEMAQRTLVEQHAGCPDRAHFYFYSPIPFPHKTPDPVLGLEVKGCGEHGIMFCAPSMHKDGYPYEIIGTTEPASLNILQAREMIQHLNHICIEHGLEYLADVREIRKLKPMLKSLTIDKNIRIYQGKRHLTLLAAADSLLLSHLGNRRKKGDLKDFLKKMNDLLCEPEPLPEQELDEIWESALEFVAKNKREQLDRSPKNVSLVEEASEAIMSKHRLLTIEESKEILYYKDGVYVPGGEILVEKEAERMYRYHLANKHLSEIKGHVMRSTYRTHDEIDSDLDIINMKNGLYNIRTGEFREHSPGYLSINQIPVIYNPKAKPKMFGKFLREVLYPSEIRTAIELIAYTFYPDNPFEIITILFGYGANGKNVFTGLLTALHGAKRISNVPLSSMLEDRFALSDLEGKSVNIDTELTNTAIRDTSILKKLTGRQPMRIQRKNQRTYDVRLYAKLYFNANRIPATCDDSDAFFRRKIILASLINLKERKMILIS
jgi:hypothetical protein